MKILRYGAPGALVWKILRGGRYLMIFFRHALLLLLTQRHTYYRIPVFHISPCPELNTTSKLHVSKSKRILEIYIL